LEQKIIEFTQEIVRGMELHLLGSLTKPFEKTVVAFMVKRIGISKPEKIAPENLMRVSELTRALDHDYILPYYQPKVNFRTGELVGLESLIRLDLPTSGITTPDKFLPVAEQFEMMDQVTAAMLGHVCKDFSAAREQLGGKSSLAVNVSPFELNNNKLPQHLKKALEKYDLTPDHMVVEITENSPLRTETQLKNFNRLRIQGFNLSLDDYGSGFTNLYQLKSLPFNEIKIDRALCHGIWQDKVLQIIVESTRRVCDELNLRLVAEGVSDPRDFQMLDKLGIDVIQGYLFCRPRTMNEVIQWYGLWQRTFAGDTRAQR
ncbi:MAG: EAL domain-containing protein, partial [Pseudomonadales bacterium]|nr:EAL domain-containing protein [Pseudomonadales bacterium]